MMRDARLTQIFEGTSQIQEMIIADHLLGVRSGEENGRGEGSGILGGVPFMRRILSFCERMISEGRLPLLVLGLLFCLGVEGPAQAAVEVGSPAPEFCLPATGGDPICLKDYRGKKNVVLLFYVLDFTRG